MLTGEFNRTNKTNYSDSRFIKELKNRGVWRDISTGERNMRLSPNGPIQLCFLLTKRDPEIQINPDYYQVKTKDSKAGHLYIVQEREFMRIGESTYKIGKTRKGFQRIKSYPKGSKLCFMVCTADIDNHERKAIDLFKSKFTQRRDYGIEYFTGDLAKMMKAMLECI